MPKYILSPDGSIKEEGKDKPLSGSDITNLSKQKDNVLNCWRTQIFEMGK